MFLHRNGYCPFKLSGKTRGWVWWVQVVALGLTRIWGIENEGPKNDTGRRYEQVEPVERGISICYFEHFFNQLVVGFFGGLCRPGFSKLRHIFYWKGGVGQGPPPNQPIPRKIWRNDLCPEPIPCQRITAPNPRDFLKTSRGNMIMKINFLGINSNSPR